MLIEGEHAPEEGEEGGSRGKTSGARRQAAENRPAYPAQTLSEQRDRLTDLVPRRAVTLLALWLVAATAIVGIGVLHVQLVAGPLEPVPQLAAFDVTAAASLRTWFSSVTLLLCSFVALQTYTIRRHRQDDYRGKYRWWWWTAAGLLAASIDAAAGLHQALEHAISATWGPGLAVGGPLLWIAPLGLIYGPLGLRMLLEMKAGRGVLCSLLFTAGLYVAAVGCVAGYVEVGQPLYDVLIEATLSMAAHFMLLFTLTLNVRRIIFEVLGLVSGERRTTTGRERREQRRREREGRRAEKQAAKEAARQAAADKKAAKEAARREAVEKQAAEKAAAKEQREAAAAARREKKESRRRKTDLDASPGDSQPHESKQQPAKAKRNERKQPSKTNASQSTSKQAASKQPTSKQTTEPRSQKASGGGSSKPPGHSGSASADVNEAEELARLEAAQASGKPLSKAQRRRLRKLKRRQDRPQAA